MAGWLSQFTFSITFRCHYLDRFPFGDHHQVEVMNRRDGEYLTNIGHKVENELYEYSTSIQQSDGDEEEGQGRGT